MKFALITPSYAPDFERCNLLCESVQQRLTRPFNHYVIVDERDLALFRKLENSNTTVLTVESILPWWIRRVPFLKKVWFSLKTQPLRNWLIQQIVKIAIAQQISEDVAVFVDSDVVFVRPFDLQSLHHNGEVRLYRDPIGNDVQKQWHLKWHESASRLLGLSNVDPLIPDYIGNIITWKRENVVQLCQRIELISGRSWIETVANTWDLSEYVLYGTFVTQLLQDKSDHYYDSQNICLDYWLDKPLTNEEDLKRFIEQIRPEHVALMISAKSNTFVSDYAKLIKCI